MHEDKKDRATSTGALALALPHGDSDHDHDDDDDTRITTTTEDVRCLDKWDLAFEDWQHAPPRANDS